MQRFVGITVITLAGLVLSGGAFAQENIDFKRHDTNSDGYLSQDEWNSIPGVTKTFDAIDTNRDGRLSKAEVEAGVTAEERNISQEEGEQPPVISQVSDVESQPRNVAMYDTDNDNRISREEAHKDGELTTYFIIWDMNQDGFLNQDELSQGSRRARQDKQEQDTSGQDTKDRDSGKSDRMDTRDIGYTGQAASQAREPVDFDRYDANGDGYLTETE